MAVLDDSYIENAIGTAEHDALFTDAGVLNTGARTQIIASAVARCSDALVRAGYAAPAVSDTPAVTVRDCALGVYLRLAYGRKGLNLPDQYAAFVDLEERIGNGTVPIAGMEPAARGAVGGVSFSDASVDSTASTARPQVFSRYRLRVY